MKKISLFIFCWMMIGFAQAQCGTNINPPGSGNCLMLNGSNQSVTMPDSDDWHFSSGDFAIECWVNPANASTRTLLTQSLANAGVAGTSSFYMSVNSNGSGTFDFYSTTGTTWTNTLYTPAGSVPSGVWTHVAITRTSGTVKVYINGIAVSFTGSVASTLANGNQPLEIGAQNGGLFFNGGIEEMRIFKGAAPSQNDVRDWMNKKITSAHPQWANCVAYYRFDEESTTNVYDRKKCNNGVFNGIRTYNLSDAPVGDVSGWDYSGSTSAAFIKFGTTNQDSLRAQLTSGTAAGIQVYGIVDTPNNRYNIPWLQDNNRYGGVWVVNGTNPQYTLTYGYAGNPALANTSASNLHLYRRVKATSLGWAETPNAINNTGGQYFTANGENSEYILGGANVVTPPAGPPNLSRVEYFFDVDPGFGNGTATNVTTTDITTVITPSISGLTAGVHRIFVRSQDVAGKWSLAIPTRFFYEPAFSNPIQNITKAEYFFDNDPGFGNAISQSVPAAASVSITMNPSLTSLSAGMHNLFVRTQDAAGKWSLSTPTVFYYEPAFSNPIQNITKAEYFFDNDPGFGHATNASITTGTDITFNLSPAIGSLPAGMHNFFIRTQDGAGKWSSSTPTLFYYEPAFSNPVQNITKAEYFFDIDPGFGKANNTAIIPGAAITFNLSPSLSSLSAGMHNFFLRTQDANGKWSLSTPTSFYYEPGFASPLQNIVKAEYFFDKDSGFGSANNINITTGTDITFNLSPDIANLAAGLHNLFIRTLDAAGKWSLSSAALFFYEPAFSNPLQNIVKAEYFFDTDPGFGNAVNTPVVPGSDITFNLNPSISNLSMGLHRMFMRTKDAAGKWSISTPALFYYEPINNNTLPTITRAEYYIDNFVPFGNGIPVVISPDDSVKAMKFPVNITGIASGGHRFYLRTKDVNGKWSLTSWANFTLSGSSNAPAIVINSFTPIAACAGSSIDVAFHSTGNYLNGNVFALQLSDGSGLFANPVVLGSVSGTVSSVIKAVIPSTVQAGINSYKLRVVSSLNAVNGATSDSSLAVIGTSQNYSDTTIFFSCYGDTYNLNALYNVSGGGIWNTPNPETAAPGSYKYFVTAGGGCSDTADVVLLLEVATWTGAINSDWHNANNWNIHKVPSAVTHVIIPTGVANPCIISTEDAEAASLHAKSNGSFQIINNKRITIKGVCSTLPPS